MNLELINMKFIYQENEYPLLQLFKYLLIAIANIINAVSIDSKSSYSYLMYQTSNNFIIN